MRTQGMTGFYARMIELAPFGHTDPLHDFLAARIEDGCEGEYLFESECLKAMVQTGARRFGRQSRAPELLPETPADLDTGRKPAVERRFGEAGKSDEFPGRPQLEGIQAVSVFVEKGPDAPDHGDALLIGIRTWKVLQNSRVLVHAKEGFDIFGDPSSQSQAVG